MVWPNKQMLRISLLFFRICHWRFFLYKQRFFQPQCYLTFLWIELQMLLRCCLKNISIIILRHFLYLFYLRFCLDLGLCVVMSYLCGLIFIFISIFIMINRIISWKQTHLFFLLILEYFLLFLYNNVDEECG